MKPPILVMNFSRIYEHESFLKNRNFDWIDCSDIQGTSCFCDDEARKTITAKIANYGPEGIHFMDSGNYHYASLFWIEKIKEPFTLVVFDHHTDIQPSTFGDILSCGNWIKEALDTNPMIRKVVIAGASTDNVGDTAPEYHNRLVVYSDKSIKGKDTIKLFAGEEIESPAYISIDKDVLSARSSVTNWDHGTITISELKKLLTIILKKHRVIGVDICGELAYSDDPLELLNCEMLNNEINRELCRVINANAR